MNRIPRFVAGAAAAAVLALSTAAEAAVDRQWQTFVLYWEGGDVEALLVYGTPQSDDVVISATCSSDDPGRIVVDLLVDLGPAAPDAPTTAHFKVGDRLYSYRATTHDSELVPYGRIALALDDPLWEALQANRRGEVSLFYAEATEFHAAGLGTEPVTDFITECAAIAAENPR